MSAQVIPLFDYFAAPRDWTQHELAEFYRVESALIQAGLGLETERGLTDEGDPWFVFCRADTGEAFIHFARIDGKYIAVGSALDEMVEGRDFAALVQEILNAQAWVLAKARNRSNVFLHPSALLIAIVGAAFFHSGEAKAAETASHPAHEAKRHILPLIIGGDKTSPALDANEVAAIVSSVLIEWGRLAPTAPTGGDVLPLIAAAGAADLAPPPALGHFSPVVSDMAAETFAQSADPVAPPADLSAQPAAASGVGLLMAAGPASAPLADHALADSVVLDSGLTLPLPLPTSALPVVAILVDGVHSEAAAILQSANILADLAAQPVVVTPSAALTGLVDHGQHLAIGHGAAPAAQPADTGAAGQAPALAVADSAPAAPVAPIVSDAPPAPAPLSGIDPHVTAAVLQFTAEVATLDVAVSGREIILYDGAIFQHLPAGTELESMTFNFADGSSISLVGTVTELQHLHFT
ncbi:MAG TPA: hypothetical protein VGI30_12590 [Caulobacteraceae bacterium]|jgi:hypothetical protein